MKIILLCLPSFILQPILNLIGYIVQNVNWSIPCLGIRNKFFGNIVIMNFGKDGYENIAFPILSYMQVSCTLLMGKMHKVPRIVDGQISSKKCIECKLYVDHRYTDGSKGSGIYKTVFLM